MDATASPRWQRVCRAFRQGESEPQMSRRIQKGLYGFVRCSINELARRGVSMDDLLHAATSCHRDLPELIRRCREHPFAAIIADYAERAGEGISCQELLDRVMADLLDRVFDQFGEEVVGRCEAWPNYHDFDEFLGHVREGVQGDVEQIATRLAENPEWEPRAPSRPRAAAQVDAPLFNGHAAEQTPPADDAATEATRSLLGESLLNRRPEQ